MNAPAKPIIPAVQPDMSLAAVLGALAPHGGKALVFAYSGEDQVRAGYHITEVKAGSFVTLDCGGNPDAWQETVLQIEDIPATGNTAGMTTDKFRSIISKVDSKVRLSADARLTIEVSRPNEPMQVYDVVRLVIDGEQAIIQLGARPAICKPRHRAAQGETVSCCTPSVSKSGCCA